ncbi:MAG: hypothetical protein M3O62_15445 [Pseudomonadota bacterium]|nr:hypothetical protein [Pseudomonadota bacterium]
MNKDTALRWIRIVATFDLLATAPMAVPVIGGYYAAWLFTNLGLSGSPMSLMPIPAMASVFIALAGVLAVLWNGCRARHPQLLPLTQFDLGGRCAVAALLVYFLLVAGVPAVLWLFVATELIGALIEWRALRALQQGQGTG